MINSIRVMKSDGLCIHTYGIERKERNKIKSEGRKKLLMMGIQLRGYEESICSYHLDQLNYIKTFLLHYNRYLTIIFIYYQ